jgi:fumarylacetoacetate (FAA) hydrolase
MKVATRPGPSPDGELLVVSDDGTRGISAGPEWPTLLDTIARWPQAQPALHALRDRLAAGQGEPIRPETLLAPLPRSWQWLDGSAFAAHAQLMSVAFRTEILGGERPLMYQGMSDRFLAPCEPARFADEAQQIDFEGEFGVIVDAVPMGTTAAQALQHVRLVVQINDWSLRALVLQELKTGFGFIQAKPACSMAPFAVTPESLGNGWQDGRVHLDLAIDWNGQRFGRANGREMAYGFHELIAHAAATRDLVAGTIIGSGTVANAAWAQVGSSCISERRAIEIIEGGKPATRYMQSGDRVVMQARSADGDTPFGTIDQVIVIESREFGQQAR